MIGRYTLALVFVFLGCSKGETPKEPMNEPSKNSEEKTTADKPKELVVYSGRSAKLVDPIFERFEAKTQIKVRVRQGKSDGLSNRVALEGTSSEADVILLQESGYLEVLGRKGFLKPLPENLTSKVPPSYVGSERNWIGVSGRARVLVYSTEGVQPKDLPTTLEALADPKWQGQIGWAPTNASFEAHVSALRYTWGEEKTRSWLKKMKALAPKKYPKNSPQVRAVDKGEIKIGWVNHYYLLRQKAANPELKAANHSFQTAKDPGNLMMLSGAAIVKTTKQPVAAEAFLNFLLSDEIQAILTQRNYEYPTVAGIPLGEGLTPIGDRLSQVSQEHLTDIAGTQKLLQSVGLR